MSETFLTICIVLAFGVISLSLVYKKTLNGVGPYTLKLFGIVIVATLLVVVALHDASSVNAAVGILGAIVGYLFGFESKANPNSEGN